MQLGSSWLRCAALWLVVVCAAIGCGDDDDTRTPARDAGRPPRDAGRARLKSVTPGQAVAGVCLLSGASPEFDVAGCHGFDKLEVCARQQCDLELCIDQCPRYLTCLAGSRTICDLDCFPEEACQQCMSEVARCVFTGACVHTFECAGRVRGGYCDQLLGCCAQLGARRRDCTALAEASAALQGEQSCLTLLGNVWMLDDAGVPCEIRDAGPP